MSYAPSTKLSHTNGTARATMLTGENVMVTAGLGCGQMMKLADWIILADGAPIQEAALSTQQAEANIAHASAMWATAYAQQNSVVGTKFRWTLNPENYRVAIMTAKGVLQVKSVTDGLVDCDTTHTVGGSYPLIKAMFTDEAAWRASLPAGGTTVLSLPGKLAEHQKADAAYKSLSDVEKVQALLTRYKIRTSVWESRSQTEVMRDAAARIQYLRWELSAMTLEQEIDAPRKRGKLTRLLKNIIAYYTSVRAYCEQNPQQAEEKPIHMRHVGTGKIRAAIAGVYHLITVHGDKIAVAPETHRWSNVHLYNNFAEMGNPKLSVHYHRRTLDV